MAEGRKEEIFLRLLEVSTGVWKGGRISSKGFTKAPEEAGEKEENFFRGFGKVSEETGRKEENYSRGFGKVPVEAGRKGERKNFQRLREGSRRSRREGKKKMFPEASRRFQKRPEGREEENVSRGFGKAPEEAGGKGGKRKCLGVFLRGGVGPRGAMSDHITHF